MSAWSGQQGSTWWEPPRPATVPRRPLGDLIRTALRVYGRSFVPFLVLAALVCGLAAIVLAPADLALADIVGRLLAATPLGPGTGDLGAYQAAVAKLGPQETALELVVAIATGLMGLLALSAVVAGTPEAALGKPVSVGVALRRFAGRLVPLLLLAVVLVGIQVVATVSQTLLQLGDTTATSAGDLGALTASMSSVIVVGVVGLILEIVLLYLYVRWFVILPLIVVDDLGVRAAMRRSAQLTEGSRWYIVGALVLLLLLQAALTLGVELTAVVIGLALGAGAIDATVSLTSGAALGSFIGHLTAFSSIVGLLLVAIYYPVIAITMAILRSDFTWRAETMAALASQQAAQAAAAPQTVPVSPVGA